jgi:hypothetical protein
MNWVSSCWKTDLNLKDINSIDVVVQNVQQYGCSMESHHRYNPNKLGSGSDPKKLFTNAVGTLYSSPTLWFTQGAKLLLGETTWDQGICEEQRSRD